MRSFSKTSIARRSGCIDMHEAHFHIKRPCASGRGTYVADEKQNPLTMWIQSIKKTRQKIKAAQNTWLEGSQSTAGELSVIHYHILKPMYLTAYTSPIRITAAPNILVTHFPAEI